MSKMDRRRRLKDLHHRVNKMDLHHRVNKMDLHPPIRKYMGLLSKYVKESVNKVTKGQYDGNFGEGNSAQHAKSYGLHASDNDDIDRAIALSLSEEARKKGKAIDNDDHLGEDEELARALQESLKDEHPRCQNGPVGDVHSDSTPATSLLPRILPSSGVRVCAGCKTPLGHGQFLSCMDSVWHPHCFRCLSCSMPISECEFAVDEDHPYHSSCYKELFHPKCDVCKTFIRTNKKGFIEYRAHPFWMQKYCPSHDNDGTPRCCSCERMEPKDIKYITLDDGRKLCLECLYTSIMDTNECQPVYIDIQEFYEGLNMKVEQQIPLLLVERQALNEAREAEKMILRRPVIGPGKKIIDISTGPYKLARRCEVTAILVLYALPRLLTGYILAHEMMHAYLRLKGYRILSPEVEEGICQVLAHLWLESEIVSGSSSSIATTSAAVAVAAEAEATAALAAEATAALAAEATDTTETPSESSTKKGEKTDFEKKLGEFFKHQIETDPSAIYGDGFRAGMKAVESYGLRGTLDHIKRTGFFPR
ncbi:protein DA1-related 1 isoform X2 [Lolium perenne]|uniref:protein DA1-related 1 isoform X2 n=1 Tax=Lolium perenne TaxID=4522 RepID=UPI0021F61E74|nr:protein DA1-related 1-like isoform X2 [Lolium perenne]